MTENTDHPQSCGSCDDGDGGCIYPYYGLAPHTHAGVTGDPKSFFGSTRMLPKAEYPENFSEDPEQPGMGTFTHCLHCGAGQ